MSFFMNFKIYPDRMDMIYIGEPNSQNSKIFAQNQNKTELLKFRKKVRIFKKNFILNVDDPGLNAYSFNIFLVISD